HLQRLNPVEPDSLSKQFINKGIESARAGKYREAITSFTAAMSNQIWPTPPVILFNLGLAESKIPGCELRAVAWLSAYLAMAVFPDNDASVKDLIHRLLDKSKEQLSHMCSNVREAALSSTSNQKVSYLYQTVLMFCNAADISGAIQTMELIEDKDDKDFSRHSIV